MKKTFLLFLLSLTIFNCCNSQEWMTSLDVAKRLALVQDKMLFVMWENATLDSFPVIINNKNGKTILTDLFYDESVNQIIWEYFVPVKIKESKYEELFNDIKDKRDLIYIDKFNDDSIKIMDANGNILNTDSTEYYYANSDLSYIINNYALNTTFLKQDLINYSKAKLFSTSYRLASKYSDFAIYAHKSIRKELIGLSNIYLEEAINHLAIDSSDQKGAYTQKCELLKMKHFLILNRPKKTLRLLKKFKDQDIEEFNKPLKAFLYYTSYKLLNDEEEALKWKTRVSKVDLRKTNSMLNNTL